MNTRMVMLMALCFFIRLCIPEKIFVVKLYIKRFIKVHDTDILKINTAEPFVSFYDRFIN